MNTQTELLNFPLHVSEQRDKVLLQGHGLLLSNAKDYKNYLLDNNVYIKEIADILNKLSETTNVADQSRLLALIVELDVADPSRIGESLIDTLKYDLKTKAEGSFEFKPGDKNLAIALLKLLETEDHPVAELINDLCREQSEAGIATPFDYRRLTAKFDIDWVAATVEEWVDFFTTHTPEELRESVEVGLSFSSTKAQRYSDEDETWLAVQLKGKCANLLDVGGSIGVSSKHLMDLLAIDNACVTDYRTEEQLEACFYGGFEKQEGISYVLGDEGDITRNSPNTEEYDLVTVNNVLVHIRDKEKALQNILPRVAEGGHLLLTADIIPILPEKVFGCLRKKIRNSI
ncbi:MAG: class I SAM-dependent methyltransferase [Microgenomates group bacterium]